MYRPTLSLFLAAVVGATPAAAGGAVEGPADVTGPTVQLVDPGAQPRQVLSYSLTEGQVDRFEITTTSAGRSTRQGQESPWIEVPAFMATVEQTVVAANEDGTYDIEAVYTAVELLDTELDRAATEAYRSQLEALVGTSTRYRIDEYGRVLASETNGQPGATASALQPSLIDTSSVQATQPLPSEAVGIGAVWEVTSVLVEPNTGFTITFANTTTLERLHADGSFELSGEIAIEAPAQRVTLPGMPEGVTLTSETDGAITAHWIIDPTRVGVEADSAAEMATTATTTRGSESESETMGLRMEMRVERVEAKAAPLGQRLERGGVAVEVPRGWTVEVTTPQDYPWLFGTDPAGESLWEGVSYVHDDEFSCAVIDVGGYASAQGFDGVDDAVAWELEGLRGSTVGTHFIERLSDEPDAVSGSFVDLPSGRAGVIDVTDADWWNTRTYVLTDGQRWYYLHCDDTFEPPPDRWLSIAESIEFLPEAE